MAEISRPSGITVSVTGPAELARAAPPPKRGVKTAAKRAVGTAGDGGLILDALRGQDLELVDSILLTIPPAARPKKRGGAAPSSAVTLDVPLGPDEQAVILLEDEGEYRWIVDGQPLPSAAPKRGVKAAKRQVRFSIDLKAAPPPPAIALKRGGVKRNWLVDKLVGKVTAYVFRFAVKLAGKKVVEFLERKVEQGLVAITTPDPQKWARLGDDEALPIPLPADRPARVLLFVHGTFSSTVGSFGALGLVPEGRDFLVRALTSEATKLASQDPTRTTDPQEFLRRARASAGYDAVLGFDHPTLSVDPLKNATDLLARLRRVKWPHPPLIDIVAFSRGGLVARSLIEHLLPGSRWGATIGRVVFVGCTNGGTQLAEPDNWHRFADHYTNLALGATRALSFIPGAQGWTTIANQVIRGVGVLVKALASGAVTDNLVPGLAAMEPDGAFVTTINQAQAGQPAAADAEYFAVMSDFEAGKALRSGSTPELPPKLLMRIADWGADELYGEANDLVVHVRSMTEIDPALGDYVKGKLDYGTNGDVYHTNYFTRGTTATQLAAWLGLPGGGPVMVKRRVRGSSGLPRSTESQSSSVDWNFNPAIEGGDTKTQKPRRAGPRARVASSGNGSGAGKPTKPIKKAPEKATPVSPKHGLKAAVKKAAKKPPVKKAAAKKAAPKPPVKAPQIKKAKKAGAKKPLSPAARGASPKRSAKKSSTTAHKAAKSPMKNGGPRKTALVAGNGGGRKKAQVECHFRAEMDQEVVVDTKVSVDVTIARHALQVTAGRAGAAAAATVEAEKKLIVQIAERRNFRVDGERRVEIDVPAPDEEANLSFDVTGLVAGEEGELWVQVRQGPVPLVTLKLKPRIIATAGAGPVARLPVEAELAEIPAPEAPLDEMRIVELMVGDSVQYLYLFDLPSLKIREDFKSPLIRGRDTYITKILNRIGDAWAGGGKDQLEAFETDLKSIGAMMFTELMPREMQELLWEQRDRITSVQVFSMEPFIPWELVYLKDPRKAVIDEASKFLGELGLVRWLYDGYPPAQLSLGKGRARYIIPTYTGDMVLPDAAGEEQMLKKLFKATPVKARALDVQKLLRTPGGFDLLHFGGHAEAAGAEQGDARLILDQLDDGTTENALLATTVAQTAQLESDGHRPIVVLNACESARMSRSFASMGGFASAFVSRGAGVFIGTHWSVGDAPARTFIEAFYKSFAKPKAGTKPLQLREAVMKARQAARDGGDATWLAYVVYGHPRAVISSST